MKATAHSSRRRLRGRRAPTVHVVAETPARPDRVLAAARDFSERAADLWPDVHLEHFAVHELGDIWPR